MGVINNIKFYNNTPTFYIKINNGIRIEPHGNSDHTENFATVEYVDDELEKKADITYVDDELDKKADKLVLTNLVSNGDLLLDSDSNGIPDGFILLNATANSLLNGVLTFTPTAQFGRLRAYIPSFPNDTIYFYASVKTNKSSVYIVGVNNIGATVFHSGNGHYELLSDVRNVSGNYDFIQVGDNQVSDFTPIEVDYMGAINLTKTFGAGNEPTKEQMDAIIRLKGYFQQLPMNLKDIFNLIQTRAQRYIPTLLGGTTSTNLFYAKDQNGFVDFTGRVVVDLEGKTSLDMCALPLGFRPMNSTMYSSILNNGEHTRVYIDYLGNVRVYKTGMIHLAIRFPVA